eukprot:TRINITY_DN15863_c0_g1_i2.p1 TRINITY_DN15863_c0_g1~~TRINITY_DN15863_c0_g1_i2.p1  ORF type:complete len:187 (-),score=28.78 TRINITY_DN15863_c0_g1_i2:368-928(-)
MLRSLVGSEMCIRDRYRDLVERMLLTPSEVTTNPTIADVMSVPGAIPDYTRPTGLFDGLRWSCGQTLNYLAHQKRKDSYSSSSSTVAQVVDLSEADYGKVYPTLLNTDPTSVLFTPLKETLTPFYNPSRQHAYFSVASASSAPSASATSSDNNGKRTTTTATQPSPIRLDGITECDRGSGLLRGRF